MSVNKLIDKSVKCTICGTAGVGTCDCWEYCSCGWTSRKGESCRNPNTTNCSTKLKYGKAKRSKK